MHKISPCPALVLIVCFRSPFFPSCSYYLLFWSLSRDNFFLSLIIIPYRFILSRAIFISNIKGYRHFPLAEKYRMLFPATVFYPRWDVKSCYGLFVIPLSMSGIRGKEKGRWKRRGSSRGIAATTKPPPRGVNIIAFCYRRGCGSCPIHSPSRVSMTCRGL
jgi:hypothetical protein